MACVKIFPLPSLGFWRLNDNSGICDSNGSHFMILLTSGAFLIFLRCLFLLRWFWKDSKKSFSVTSPTTSLSSESSEARSQVSINLGKCFFIIDPIIWRVSLKQINTFYVSSYGRSRLHAPLSPEAALPLPRRRPTRQNQTLRLPSCDVYGFNEMLRACSSTLWLTFLGWHWVTPRIRRRVPS